MVLRLLRILIWSWAESKQEYGVFLFPSLEFSFTRYDHECFKSLLLRSLGFFFSILKVTWKVAIPIELFLP